MYPEFKIETYMRGVAMDADMLATFGKYAPEGVIAVATRIERFTYYLPTHVDAPNADVQEAADKVRHMVSTRFRRPITDVVVRPSHDHENNRFIFDVEVTTSVRVR